MRHLSNSLFVLCASLSMIVACGAPEEEDVTPPSESTAQVEQAIGMTPDCGPGGTLQSQTTWGTTCAKCTEVGGDGSWPPGAIGYKGSLYQRCCASGGSCGGWQLIRPVCSSCELN